ncbi:SBBP repeat-containing protein [Planctomycetota bacterium]
MKKLFLTILILWVCIASFVAKAQIRSTGFFFSDEVQARDMAIDDKGNIYITGNTVDLDNYDKHNYNYGTVKYNSEGKKIWKREYDGPLKGFDYANSVGVDKEGNVYVTGSIQLTPKRDPNSIFLKGYATIKYAPDGHELWATVQGGPQFKDSAKLVVCNNGSVCITGRCKEVKDDFGIFDFLTIKYDPNGRELWKDFYDGPRKSLDIPYDIAIDNLKNTYVTGSSTGEDSDNDIAIIKYGPNGQRLWVARYKKEGYSCSPAGMEVDNFGNVYVVGSYEDKEWKKNIWLTPSGVSGSSPELIKKFSYIVTVKYDPKGHELWSQIYKKSDLLIDAKDVVLDRTGNVYVSGFSKDNLVMIKYNGDGKQMWDTWYQSKVIQPTRMGDFCRIWLGDQGNVYHTAYIPADTEMGTKPLLVKYNDKGALEWAKSFQNISEFAKLIYP